MLALVGFLLIAVSAPLVFGLCYQRAESWCGLPRHPYLKPSFQLHSWLALRPG